MDAGYGAWIGRVPVAARRLDTLAAVSLETGQDSTRRLAGRVKGWTMTCETIAVLKEAVTDGDRRWVMLMFC
jgi:hypothetical protein